MGYIRKTIGYIPQHPVLFNETVLYNVRYGNEHLPEQQVYDLIQRYKIDEKLANGVHTRVGKGGMDISGGQRQLVWCLRVMLQNPDILIVDEPTASMDDDTKNKLVNIMGDMMNGKTVIFVSHDPYLINQATRKISL